MESLLKSTMDEAKSLLSPTQKSQAENAVVQVQKGISEVEGKSKFVMAIAIIVILFIFVGVSYGTTVQRKMVNNKIGDNIPSWHLTWYAIAAFFSGFFGAFAVIIILVRVLGGEALDRVKKIL